MVKTPNQNNPLLYKCSNCDFTNLSMGITIKHMESHVNDSEQSPFNSAYPTKMDEPESPPASTSTSLVGNENHWASEGIQNHLPEEQDESIELRWSTEQTFILIRLITENYDKFDSQMKKTVWKYIATQLTKICNKPFTGEQCDSKWKALKVMYKKVLDHNTKRTGARRKVWDFFEPIHSLLLKKEITPIATCSTAKGMTLNRTSTPYGGTLDQTDESQFELMFSRKRKSGADFSIQKRHKEKMEKQDRFLDLFEKLVDHLTDENKN